MKKLIIFAAMAVIAIGFIAGCASVPEHSNMTGNWKYTFEETGRDGVLNGTMTIAQDSYKLSGKCNDAFGEFELKGSISENGPKFMIDGKRNDFKRNFHLTGMLSSDNEFEGTYTTDQNTSGTMRGSRVGVN
jgi:opacity protein-like surface antigen